MTRLDATVIDATGATHVDAYVPAKRPVDCFFVYGAISNDPGPNADMTPAPNEEVSAIRTWPAQLSRVCNVYAPIYRQIPASNLGTRTTEFPTGRAGAVAYGDVLDAWKQYVANDNHGRGVVVIGESEGGSHLRKLIRDEIDSNPYLRSKLVVAYVIGWAVVVPTGSDGGGSFRHIPACRDRTQTGCVVSWNSYSSTAPPGPDSRYGKPKTGAGDALCTNPAALSGGSTPLDTWFRVTGAETTSNQLHPTTTGYADPSATPPPTSYVELPALASGRCLSRDGVNYLDVTVTAKPGDPRIDTLPGDLGSSLGLHLANANIVLGNMLNLIRSQADAFAARH